MASEKSIFEQKSDCQLLIRCPYYADACNVSYTIELLSNKADNNITLAPNKTRTFEFISWNSIFKINVFVNDTILLFQYNFTGTFVKLYESFSQHLCKITVCIFHK